MEKHKSHQIPQATETSNSISLTDAEGLSFGDHIRELRSRIFWVAVLFLVTSAAAYQFRDILVHLVLSPLGDQKLIYLNPAGGFSFIFQITMYAGALVTAPFLIYQLYQFVMPALPRLARKFTPYVFLSASMLMVIGVLFGYFVAVPAALKFLTTFAGGYVQASLTADSYLSFILSYVAGLGLLFQLPLLLLLVHFIKPFTPKSLLNSQRFMILFAFIAAAVITPTPDIVNQLLIAGPILFIYQLGVVAILIMIRGQKRRDKKAAKKSGGKAAIPLHTAPSAQPTKRHTQLQMPALSDLAPVTAPRTQTSLTKNAMDMKKPRPVAAQQLHASKPKPTQKLMSPKKVTYSMHMKQSAPASLQVRRPVTLDVTSTRRAQLRPTLDHVYANRGIVQRPTLMSQRQGSSIDGFMMQSRLQKSA